MDKQEQPWCIVYGSVSEGFVVYGPFPTQEQAFDFEQFFCNGNSSDLMQLADPFEAQDQQHPGLTWEKILAETPKRLEWEREQGRKANLDASGPSNVLGRYPRRRNH
jgi:hypothetical protein